MGIQTLQIANRGGEHIKWLGKTNVTESELSTLQKTGGAAGVWDAGAYSDQQAASGKIRVEIQASETDTVVMIGLNNAGDAAANSNYTNLKYAIFLFLGNAFYYSESGSVGLIGTKSLIDTAFVQVNDAGQVEYGYERASIRTILRTVTSPTLNYPLVADCSMERANSFLTNCRIKIG